MLLGFGMLYKAKNRPVHFHFEFFLYCTVKPVHNGLCPQRKPAINGHFAKNTSFLWFLYGNEPVHNGNYL
jgi:hypothetical protein